MSLRSKFFSLFTAAAAMAALATFSFAQDSPKPTTAPDKKAERPSKADGHGFGGHRMGGKRAGHRGMHAGRMGMGPMHGINLTDAQKEQIRAIRQANKPDASLREELRTIMQARRAGTITDAQKERAKAIRQERAAKRKSVREQIQAVLTPEQKAQIEQHRNQMKQRREEFRQKREEFRQKRQARPAVKTGETT